MNKKRASFKFAVVKTLPITISYFFVAMAFGLVLRQGGWNWIWAAAISIFIYTGAFQFVLAAFMNAGASFLTVVFTALFMNARQLFYGLSYIDDFQKTGKRFPYMIHSLTDETYALFNSIKEYPDDVDKPDAQFMMAVLCHASWVLGSIVGNLAGGLIPSNIQGVDYALTALFITIFIDQWRGTKNHKPALTGVVCSVLFLILLGPDNFLLPSLIVTTAVLIVSNRKEKAYE